MSAASGEQSGTDNFKKIITDFVSSFLTTFPEYVDAVRAFTGCETHSHDDISDDAVARLLNHCQAVYPERFFDILYQNENMFSPDPAVSNNVSVEFIPGVNFKSVWGMSDITDTTKQRIWKHLQLITFTIVGSMSQSNLSFGDTAKLFEAINEDELRVKLEETMTNLHSMFDTSPGKPDSEDAAGATSGPGGAGPGGAGGLPDAEKMHEHLSGLLDGKIGALAKEIAEETVKELDIDVSEESSVSGVFQKLMKNPGKLAGIVKKVGEKLDKKMKSGDIKESELFKEASEFMTKMKGSGGKGGKGGGGMGDIAQLLKSLNLNMGDLAGLGGLGSGAGGGGKTKVNLGAMQSQLGRNFKMAQNKERMQKKLEEHRAAALAAAADAAAAAASASKPPPPMKHSIYQTADGGRIEKTPRLPAHTLVTNAGSDTNDAPTTALSDSANTGYGPDLEKKKKKNKNKK